MPYTSSQEIIVTHAALGGILGMIIWPLAAVIGRLLRTYYPKWIRLHYIVSGVIGVPVLIVVFALGTAHKQGDDDNWTTYHFRAGLVLLLLGLIQAIYGTVIHQPRLKPPVVGPKSVLTYIHPVVGFVIIILGFAQVYTGFQQWHKPGHIPHGVIVAWGVLLALWMVIYLGGFALLPRQWRQRKEEVRMGKGGHMDEGYEVGDGPRRDYAVRDGRNSSVQALARPSVDARTV